MTEHTTSYYAASANPSPVRAELNDVVSADVCVIGAGYTGLSTALHLAERGFDVVVLEAARVGWGASGRKCGQIVNGFSRDLETIERRYGKDAAVALGAMSLEGGDIIRDRIERYAIACDYRPTNVITAFSNRQMRELERMKHNWEHHGHDQLEMLDKAALAKHLKSDIYIGGLIDHRGGHIHPLNLALGEAAAFESLGGVIHEKSPVTKVESRDGRAVVSTAKGQVVANYAVVAGNAYLNGVVPFLHDKIMPVSTQVITTEVLGEATVKELMPTLSCVEDANYILDYYRPTADHRILFGGGTVYGAAEPADIEAKLRPNLAKVFPALADVRFDYRWSGNFALTLTRIPHLGRIGREIYFAHGDSGHGVTYTHLAGRIIAEAIDGDAKRFNTFADLRYFPFPGGRTFRVPLTVAGSWWYGLRDRLGV